MGTGRKLIAPFTLEHYRQLLRRLIDRGDVEFITYQDFFWNDVDDHRGGYPQEWAGWQKRLQSGEISKKTVYVLIQHDIDSGPSQTIEMLKLESEYGICSTTMLFNKWRGEHGKGDLVDYPVDFSTFVEFEKQGYVFGYHCNAFQNANFSESGIYRLFHDDVIDLRKHLKIDFFSPHGGQTMNGLGNASFDYMCNTNVNIKHVHNGCSPRFNSSFSDGGLLKRLSDNPDKVNFFKWSDELKAGGRFRLLIHPQYFSDENFQPFKIDFDNWYSSLVKG